MTDVEGVADVIYETVKLTTIWTASYPVTMATALHSQ